MELASRIGFLTRTQNATEKAIPFPSPKMISFLSVEDMSSIYTRCGPRDTNPRLHNDCTASTQLNVPTTTPYQPFTSTKGEATLIPILWASLVDDLIHT